MCYGCTLLIARRNLVSCIHVADSCSCQRYSYDKIRLRDPGSLCQGTKFYPRWARPMNLSNKYRIHWHVLIELMKLWIHESIGLFYVPCMQNWLIGEHFDMNILYYLHIISYVLKKCIYRQWNWFWWHWTNIFICSAGCSHNLQQFINNI